MASSERQEINRRAAATWIIMNYGDNEQKDAVEIFSQLFYTIPYDASGSKTIEGLRNEWLIETADQLYWDNQKELKGKWDPFKGGERRH